MTLLRWNKEFALEQATDDRELLLELLDIFKASLSADLQRIKEGLAAEDSGKVAGAAHSIKGASSSLGITGITEIAKRIEDNSTAGGLEQVGDLLPQLELMCQEMGRM